MKTLRLLSLSHFVSPVLGSSLLRRLTFGAALGATLTLPSGAARADSVVGVKGETAFPSAGTSGVERSDSLKVGAGFGLQIGYEFELGPVALRPEAVVDYTRMPTSVLRLMAGGRMQTTGLIAPFAIAHAGWGRGTFETTAGTPWSSPPGDQVYSISRSGFAYELGGGIGFRPSRSFELELLVAYNGASEPAFEDAPYLDAHWLSAGIGATYHF
jgi:hypothetical protein